MSKTHQFPAPVRLHNRLFFVETAVDDHLRAIAGLPPLKRDPNAPVRLLAASEVALRLGVGRRTIGRRIGALAAATLAAASFVGEPK